VKNDATVHVGVRVPPPFVALLYVAVALWMNSWWAMVMLLPVLLVFNTAVIAREERNSGSAFTDRSAACRARTRRWL